MNPLIERIFNLMLDIWGQIEINYFYDIFASATDVDPESKTRLQSLFTTNKHKRFHRRAQELSNADIRKGFELLLIMDDDESADHWDSIIMMGVYNSDEDSRQAISQFLEEGKITDHQLQAIISKLKAKLKLGNPYY